MSEFTTNTTSKILASTKEAKTVLKEKFNKYANIVTNSSFFKNKCREVFDSVDVDKSGSVDVKELYAAILLVYLQLAKFVRGLTPPTHEDLHKLMKQVDLDGQETLSFEEFVDLTTILLGNIASRAVVQLLLSLVVVPMLATILMSVLCFLHPPHYIWSYVVPAGVPTTILSSLLLMFSLPTLIEHVDAYFLKRASVVSEGKKKS